MEVPTQEFLILSDDLIKKTKSRIFTDVPKVNPVAFSEVNPQLYALERKKLTFIHESHPNETLLLSPALNTLQQDQETLENVEIFLKNSSINYEFSYFRDTITLFDDYSHFKQMYLEFVEVIVNNIYQPFYNKAFSGSREPVSPLGTFVKMKEIENSLRYDLCNQETINRVIMLEKIFDQTSDDEITSSLFLSNHLFLDSSNLLLSPAALALSSYHHYLLHVNKKNRDERCYSKSNLPRVTYLSLTGVFSEIDIDVLNSFSDTIQTIVVYDKETGGPSILKKHEFSEEKSFRSKYRDFQKISQKLLLVPLDCSSSKQKDPKIYFFNDLMTILENLVFPSIVKYKPSFIVLNCSFIFDKENQTPFSVTGEEFAEIINHLQRISDCKIIVYPFRLPILKNSEHQLNFLKRNELQESLAQRLDYIYGKYGVPYSELYLADCVGNVLESLSNMKPLTFPFQKEIRKQMKGINPLTHAICYMISRYYKSHPYYSFLYTKGMGFLAKISEKEGKHFAKTEEDYKLNELPLYCSEEKIGMLKLESTLLGSVKTLILDKDSQYIFNYSDMKNPKLFIMNSKICVLEKAVKIFGESSHFILDVKVGENGENPYVKGIETIPINDPKKIIVNSGLCYCENYVFQVYGTEIGTKVCSNRIYYYDTESKKQYQISIENHEILPRQSPTVCAFKGDNNIYYLYVFGGRINSLTKFKGRDLGALDIIDIVEVYSTNNPANGKWSYKMINKDNFPFEKTIRFVPYHESYAYYLKESKKILIMGGRSFKGSVHERTFPVFEFDVNLNSFTSCRTFVNELKNDPLQRLERKFTYKRMRAISDINKNYLYLEDTKQFVFVIPQEESQVFDLYSYHYVDKLEPVSLNQVVDKRKPVSLNQLYTGQDRKASYINSIGMVSKSAEKVDKTAETWNVRFSSKFGYLIESVAEKIAFSKLVEWRSQKTQNVTETDILKYLDDMLLVLKNQKEDETFPNVQFNTIDNKFEGFKTLSFNIKQNKEILQPLVNGSSIIKTMRDYIELEISENYEIKAQIIEWESRIFNLLEEKMNAKKHFQAINKEKIDASKFNNIGIERLTSIIKSMATEFFSWNSEITLSETKRNVRYKPSEDINEIETIFKELQNTLQNEEALLEILDKFKFSISFFDKIQEITIGTLSVRPRASYIEPVFHFLKNLHHWLSQFLQYPTKLDKDETIPMITSESPNKNLSISPDITQIEDEKSISKLDQSMFTPLEESKMQRSIIEQEESIEKTVQDFKEAIKTENGFLTFFNHEKTELIIANRNQEYMRLAFKIYSPDEEQYVGISFGSSEAVKIVNSAFVCFVEAPLKKRHFDVYKQYKSWILFADLRPYLNSEMFGKRKQYLTLKKLFLVCHDENVFNRSLGLINDNLFLIGGKWYSFKKKAQSKYHKGITSYFISKIDPKTNKNSSNFRDPECEDLDSLQGNCVSISSGDFLFITNKTNPTILEIFHDGTHEKKIEIPHEYDKIKYKVKLNLVNFRGKEEILFTLYSIDEAQLYLLYDIEKECFEKGKITLEPENAESDKYSLYTGFEEMEVTTGGKGAETLLVFSTRNDKFEFFSNKIHVKG